MFRIDIPLNIKVNLSICIQLYFTLIKKLLVIITAVAKKTRKGSII